MNILSLAALGAVALLSITDPTGDAHGDGTLTPPTAPIYAHSAIFDLQEVDLSSTSVTPAGGAVVKVPATTLSVTLGAVDPDDAAPAGFSGVVVDVYLDFATGGSETTLVGPEMLLPGGNGWDYAVRLSPAGAFGVAYHEVVATTAVAPADQAEPNGNDEAADTESPAAADSAAGAAAASGRLSVADLDLQPLVLRIDGNRLIVDLPLELTEDVEVYAMTGVYDPFASTSWRPLANITSPWAYSGGEQMVPVIDVLAVDQATQTKALQTGVLPQQLSIGDRGIVWLLLMAVGLLVAITGLWFRRRVVPEARTGLPYGLPPDPDAVEPKLLDPESDEPETVEAETVEAEVVEPEEASALEQVEEPEAGEEPRAEAESVTPEEPDIVDQPSTPAEAEDKAVAGPSAVHPDSPNPQSPELKLKNGEAARDAFDLFGVELAADEAEDDDFLGAAPNGSHDFD